MSEENGLLAPEVVVLCMRYAQVKEVLQKVAEKVLPAAAEGAVRPKLTVRMVASLQAVHNNKAMKAIDDVPAYLKKVLGAAWDGSVGGSFVATQFDSMLQDAVGMVQQQRAPAAVPVPQTPSAAGADRANVSGGLGAEFSLARCRASVQKVFARSYPVLVPNDAALVLIAKDYLAGEYPAIAYQDIVPPRLPGQAAGKTALVYDEDSNELTKSASGGKVPVNTGEAMHVAMQRKVSGMVLVAARMYDLGKHPAADAYGDLKAKYPLLVREGHNVLAEPSLGDTVLDELARALPASGVLAELAGFLSVIEGRAADRSREGCLKRVPPLVALYEELSQQPTHPEAARERGETIMPHLKKQKVAPPAPAPAVPPKVVQPKAGQDTKGLYLELKGGNKYNKWKCVNPKHKADPSGTTCFKTHEHWKT